jgi:hypothetical protein
MDVLSRLVALERRQPPNEASVNDAIAAQIAARLSEIAARRRAAGGVQPDPNIDPAAVAAALRAEVDEAMARRRTER